MPSHPALGASTGFVTRSGAQLFLNGQPFRFSGPNIYWLGLDENTGTVYPSAYRVNDALDTVTAMGGTVVRAHTLGVSFGCAKCIMPARGVYNEDALRQVDFVIKAAGDRGLRLIIPLMDEYDYYHGGRATFTRWRGLSNPNDFWTNATVINDFQDYITTLLNRTNTYTGVRYRDDPTIMAWETGNELVPTFAWTDTITRKIKQLDPNHLLIDGTYGVRAENLQLAAIDIVSDHFYPRSTARLLADAAQAQTANKPFYIGEYDWTTGTDLDLFLQNMEAHAVVGDSFWSLFGHADNGGYVQHYDGYTLHYPGDDAGMRAKAESLRAHAYRMRGQSAVPAQMTPLAPQIIAVSGNVITWRGAAGAATYSIERSTTGAGGPWTALCSTNCPADSTNGWSLPTAPSGAVWYQMRGIATDGVSGPSSAVVQIGTSSATPTASPTTAPTTIPTTAPTTIPTASPTPTPPAGDVTIANTGMVGVNLDGPAVTINGESWISDAVARAHGLQVYGGTPDNKTLTLDPSPDAGTTQMLNNVVYGANQQVLSLAMPLPNGSYQVYVWTVENYKSQSRSWSLGMEGQTLASNLGMLNLGSWKKYGPYPVTVNDGTLNMDLKAQSGSPMISGFAIYGANLRTSTQGTASQHMIFGPLVLSAGT